jgi:hypothetical protein
MLIGPSAEPRQPTKTCRSSCSLAFGAKECNTPLAFSLRPTHRLSGPCSGFYPGPSPLRLEPALGCKSLDSAPTLRPQKFLGLRDRKRVCGPLWRPTVGRSHVCPFGLQSQVPILPPVLPDGSATAFKVRQSSLGLLDFTMFPWRGVLWENIPSYRLPGRS